MGLLDVNAAQLFTSQGSFEDKASLMRSTIANAESAAMQAQASHQGESAVAFQAAHTRFVEASAKINALLDLASAQIGEGGTTYVTEDATAAANISATTTAL